MDKYTLTNLRKWDELTHINFDSPMYNVERFIESKNSLKSVELSEIGDILVNGFFTSNAILVWTQLVLLH
ncbi:MAG: hypothetical protein IH840_07795 [Candidatus Heimdallarchaeota archaeon]|nr:hypothetical protein [Candidatus Heimdallarchaeota archaeon]